MNKKTLRKKIDVLETEIKTHHDEAALARTEMIQGKLYFLSVLLLPCTIGFLIGRKINASLFRISTRMLKFIIKSF